LYRIENLKVLSRSAFTMFRTALSGKVDGLCLTWQKSMDILPELELIV
jgi:hypothetical protein